MSSRRSSVSKVDNLKATATSKFKKQDTSRSKKSAMKQDSEPNSPAVKGKKGKVKLDESFQLVNLKETLETEVEKLK